LLTALNLQDDRMKDQIIENFKKAKNKLILLDYDGTLVDYAKTPEDAKPSAKLLTSLLKLNRPTSTKLVIITGRAYQDIDGFLGQLPVDIVAEHGAMIREDGKWKQLSPDNGKWQQVFFPILQSFTHACPGSFIEHKKFSLAYHYRNADTECGINRSRALIAELIKKAPDYQLKITDGKKVVEIKNKDIDKGKGTLYLLEKGDFDYILSIGDDKTDEDMFDVLANNKNAFTIKVGKGDTSAKYRLDTVQDVIVLLNELL
jgi:trehalose 6-phosphate synthase/phosphatase